MLRPTMTTLELLSVVLFILTSLAGQGLGETQSGGAWLFSRDRSPTDTNSRERESIEPAASYPGSQFSPPVQVGTARHASQLFNGRQLDDHLIGHQQAAMDLFQCVEPTRELFDKFVQQFNRTFSDNSDKLSRLNLFITSLRRTITLNRIVQNEILNTTNYEKKPEIRNYYFVAPTGARDLPLWYADITDCELGLIKYIIFDIIYLLERNEFAMAYKTAIDNSEFLPLLNEDGFEQLVNILLVRLYDRFRGDGTMNQLFRWPLYLKKLAGYAYNRRQASDPNFNAKMGLITYAYPAYFKDIKYNSAAIDRTGDNERIHKEHEQFNTLLRRQFPDPNSNSGREERNRRLAIFRQRATLLNLLNDDHKGWRNLTIHPDWLRSNVKRGGSSSSSSPLYSAKLQLQDENNADESFYSPAASTSPFGNSIQYKQTQFSDLTDTEFVTFLTNDFSLLGQDKESAEFLELNFPVQPLDKNFRTEIAAELELRRAIQLQQQQKQQDPTATAENKQRPSTFGLAKQVVDELISDVGLPMGPVMFDFISENDHYRMFKKISAFFGKSYATTTTETVSHSGSLQVNYRNGQPNESELADERQRRYEQFKLNYRRFRAWFVKEGWTLDEAQMVAMLRLADMSWQEIKLSLFKICCLTEDNLAALSAHNETIRYLGSNEFLCQQLSFDGTSNGPSDYNELIQFNGQNGNNSQATVNRRQSRELAALELYYYYSVHFNKHHLDMTSFNSRLAIFSTNIDQIRRLSCTRGLTLYRSLKLKIAHTLSTIDVLDPQRSYTDDLNLDRYKYFSVPNLNLPGNAHQSQQITDDMLGFERPQESNERSEYATMSTSSSPARLTSDSGPLSRAGISYRREAFFSSLLNKPELRNSNPPRAPGSSYADRLTYAAQNISLSARKYRENSVGRIYDLVMQRYRLCMRTLRQIEISGNERQECQSAGPHGDQANGVWAPTAEDQLNSAASLRLQQNDQCAFYRLGLEPWAEGLIKQDMISAQLITSARCQPL